MATQLTADALLASGSATHAVRIPLSLLRGSPSGVNDGDEAPAGEVTLRPRCLPRRFHRRVESFAMHAARALHRV